MIVYTLFHKQLKYCYLFCLSTIIAMQACNPQLAKNVLIDKNRTREGFGPCEPSIAINPKDTDKMVAGSIIDKVYVSDDGGKTWAKNKLTSSHGIWGDPCILADYQGGFHYFHLSNPSGGSSWEGDKLDRIVCQSSLDGGNTWGDGSFAGLAHPKDQDKEWAVADPNSHELYLTWTQFDAYGSEKEEDRSNILFSRSTDQGKSWSVAKSINALSGNCLDDDDTVEGAVPAVGTEGEVYVTWAYNNKLYFDRSFDKGETWMEEDKVIAEQAGGWSIAIPGIGRANGMPITACDLSEGTHSGAVYVNWADQRNGASDTDIWLISSKDKGETWSAPLRVNDDGPGKQQFFTWMSVDPVTGYVYIVFYDRRHHAGHETDVYLAVSKDGGKTFKNKKISESPFLPKEGQFFGDYNNISVYDGKVRPIWTRQDGRQLSVWTALIDE